MRKTVVEEYDNKGKMIKRTTIEEGEPNGSFQPIALPYSPTLPYSPYTPDSPLMPQPMPTWYKWEPRCGDNGTIADKYQDFINRPSITIGL
jgi:hypothetical protein